MRTSNLRYREMFFNPTLHTRRGVPISVVLEGMAAGIAAAKSDLGVDCRLIADVFRSDPPAEALSMVSDLINERNDALIGLGMDGEEAPDPPEKFADAFALAGAAGLHRTSHASEDAPPRNIETCLDLLGCERIDHGYYVLDDPLLVRRCRDGGIGFTTSVTTTVKAYFSPVLSEHPIRRMIDADLVVSLGSDDPTMVHTDLAQEYLQLSAALSYGPGTIRRLCLNALETSWLDDDDKRGLRRELVGEIDALEALLDEAEAAGPAHDGDVPR